MKNTMPPTTAIPAIPYTMSAGKSPVDVSESILVVVTPAISKSSSVSIAAYPTMCKFAGGYQTNRGEAQLTEAGGYDQHQNVYNDTNSENPPAPSNTIGCNVWVRCISRDGLRV